MENISVSIRSIRTKANQVKKVKASLKHSFYRVDNSQTVERNIDNQYYFKENKVQGNNLEVLKKINSYVDNLAKPNSKYNSDDITNRSKQKSKIKKWLKNKNTSDIEKLIFKNIINELDNNQLLKKSVIDDFLKIETKISRRNDKIKCLNSLLKTNNKIVKSPKKLLPLEIIVVEKIYKITNRNKVNMSSFDNRRLLKDFHLKYFSEYEIIAEVEHNDEVKPHAHLFHSSKNSITQKYDYPDAELELVKKYMKSKKIKFTFENKKWFQLKEKELELYGEVYQEMMRNFGNIWLKNNNINDYQFKKLDDEESLLMKEKYKENNEDKKAITERNFNTSNYYKEQANLYFKKYKGFKEAIQSEKNDFLELNKKWFEEGRDYIKTAYNRLKTSDKQIISKLDKDLNQKAINIVKNEPDFIEKSEIDNYYKEIDDITETKILTSISKRFRNKLK